MKQEQLEQMIREILQGVNAREGGNVATKEKTATVSVEDYPLGNKHPELVHTSTGRTLQDITLDRVLDGTITPADVRVTAETLKLQAQIARSAGRPTLANNFERAAEMTKVPDDRLLEFYNALRPYRSSQEELFAIADELETQYEAVICANFVREAAQLYKERQKLKGDN